MPRGEFGQSLGRVAGEGGWRSALAQAARPGSELWRYATDPREGDALVLLPEVTPGPALFWGNALGILPLMLAERFERVVVSDVAGERLAFARDRQAQEGVANMRCLEASDLEAEVRRGGRFRVIAIGEEFAEDGSPLPLRNLEVLARLSPLLEPRGILAYGARFRRSQCVTAVFTPLRAPSLATYPGHVRALRRAAFSTVTSYWRLPDRRPYQAFVPLNDRTVAAYYLQHTPRAPGVPGVKRAVVSLANGLGTLPSFVRNVLVIARKA